MLFTDEDRLTGQVTYTVCNDAGLCMIRTTSRSIAYFVNDHVKGIPADYKLTVGNTLGRGSRRIFVPKR